MRAARGTVELVPDPLPDSVCKAAPEVICSTHVRGAGSISTVDLLGGQLQPEVIGGILTNGKVIFILGGCCDRGELEMHGRASHGRISGKWWQTFVSDDGRTGKFVLTRAH
jgi:hypothetical protein